MLRHRGGRFLNSSHQPKLLKFQRTLFPDIWPQHSPTKHLWHGRAKSTQWPWLPCGMHVDVAMHLSAPNLNLFVLISTYPPPPPRGRLHGHWLELHGVYVNSAIGKVEMYWKFYVWMIWLDFQNGIKDPKLCMRGRNNLQLYKEVGFHEGPFIYNEPVYIDVMKL